jgi:hypothetical protein
MKLMPHAFPQEATTTLSGPILIFSITLALTTGVLFGLAPALRFSRSDISQGLQARTRNISATGSRSLNLLLGGQITLTLLLLSLAGASIAGLLRITSTKLGYDPRDVGFIGVPLKLDTGRNQPARAAYIEHLRERVATVPGVVSVSVLASGIPPSQPFDAAGTGAAFEILGHPSGVSQQAVVQLISPEYFAH